MRRLVVIAMLLLMVGVAAGQDLGNQAPTNPVPTKDDAHIQQQEGVNPRQGGDTIADATPIASLPFSDVGTTSGYTNDYDEVCPYTGSTAPDVVYIFTATEDIAISVDLCGSTYDTKVYIYDEGLSVVACNDDFYFDDVCGVYVSKLDFVFLASGITYFIVVDGYGDDSGDYELEIAGFVPCILDCPPGAVLEGEPELMDGYIDTYNPGCSADPNNPAEYIQVVQPGFFCAVSGWYDDGFRDTDWFRITLGTDGYLDWECDAEQSTYMFELVDALDCSNVSVGQLVEAGPCLPAQMTVYGAPGSDVFLWVGPTTYGPPGGFEGHEYDYVCNFGIGIVATENATWSQLKALYR